jgi:hypothetical protein
MPRF